MPRTKSDDLLSFQNWLLQSYPISTKGATVYASRVRKILKDLEQVDKTNLQKFISQPQNESSKDTFITAWTRFTEFMSETQNISLPTMNRVTKTHARHIVHHSTLEFAWYMKNITNTPMSKLYLFCWGDVKMIAGDFWEIQDPTDKGVFYRAPRIILQKLCEWCFKDDNIDHEIPLLAIYPSRKDIVPRNTLSAHLKEYSPSYTNKTEEITPKTEKQEENKKNIHHELIQELPFTIEESQLPEEWSDYQMFDPDKI